MTNAGWAAAGRGMGTLWPEDTSEVQSIPLPASPARSREGRAMGMMPVDLAWTGP